MRPFATLSLNTLGLAGLWRPALVLVVLGALPLFQPDLQAYWRFERSAVLNGECWRLISANLVHTNLPHALLNLAGLGLCCLLFPSLKNAVPWLQALLVCALSSTGFLLLYPEITWYVGLSGALHGLFLFGALQEWRMGMHSSGAIAALVLSKLLWEHWGGMEPGTADLIAAHVVTEAHWWGGMSGLTLGLIPPRRFKWTD